MSTNNNNNNNIIENDTCFSTHERLNVSCEKQDCRCWFNSKNDLNCINIATKSGPKKQEEIGNFFNLTRMRVCQIEKTILTKIRLNKKLQQKFNDAIKH